MTGKALNHHPAKFAMIIANFLIASRFVLGTETVGGQTLHDRIVKDYLESRWDEAAADLASLPKAPSTSTTKPSTHTDLDYIRKTLAECRPPWWKQIKTGKKMNFRPSVWGRTQSATYDPTAKISICLLYTSPSPRD